MNDIIERVLVQFYSDDITVWDLVSELNIIGIDPSWDIEKINYLICITDESEQSKQDIVNALSKVKLDIDSEKFGNLLMEYWLKQLKNEKITSEQFMDKFLNMISSHDEDPNKPCCE